MMFFQTKATKKVHTVLLIPVVKQIITLNNCLFDHLALWCLLRARGEFTKGRLQKIVFKVPNKLSRGGLLFIFTYLFNGWILLSAAVGMHYSII